MSFLNDESVRLFKNNLLGRNPVLVQGLGLTLVIGAGNTLKNGVVLSVITIMILTLTSFFAHLTGGKLPQNLKAPLYILFAAILLVPVAKFLPIDLAASLGFFIPLIALNALTISSIEKATTTKDILTAIIDSLTVSIGFSLVIILVSAIRELLGSGTIWGLPVPIFSATHSDVFSAIPGGFIIVGFLAGLIQFIRIKGERVKNK
jgi:electron transport complex protein RnfE